MPHVSDDYELVIKPTRGWLKLDLGEVWRYRDLLVLLVHRDFVAKYKQTILGPAWFVLQPLLMTAVFTIIFGAVAKIPTDGLPPMLFYLTGLLGWSYFAQTFTNASGTLVNNAGLFGKVYFPRLVVPLAGAASNLLAFGLQLATTLVVWGWFKLFTPLGGRFGMTEAIVWLPLLVVQIAALSLGVGLWLSALTSKYRDFAFLTPLIVQVWMYATPIIYPLSQVGERWRWLASINPMAMPIEALRLMLLGQGAVTPGYLAVSISVTVALLLSGLLLFNRVEKTFVDTV
jgi:lipopolysaccharide transport system permease protein